MDGVESILRRDRTGVPAGNHEGGKALYFNSSSSRRARNGQLGSLFTICTALNFALLCCVVSPGQGAPAAASDVPPILKIGAHAPDFDLPGVDGKRHSLKDYASSKVLVVIFGCDHCPIAEMYEKRIKQLTSDYANRGASVVVIVGNDPKTVHLGERGYTDLGDSFPEMRLRAEYRHFNYPYLYDGDTHAVALKYGPTATPHAFVSIKVASFATKAVSITTHAKNWRQSTK